MEKVGCTRQYESELSLRSFAQPFPSGDKGCTNRPTRCFFSKTYPSFLTLKEGSTSLSKPLPSQKGKDVPTALLGAQTASLYGWRTIRGLRQQRSCGFLCGDEPQGHTMPDACSMLMEPHGYDEECSMLMEPQGHTNRCLMLIARNLLGVLLMGTQGHNA